ncbi:DNA repair protein RecN [Litorimonas cladophorae]|uniref:DNA repair protein RecN n=1 Tax=Litorimonas cladophorae TaxID=1220491 RepID=A0A918KEJ5_9PROT|nr:DNA repair protein RecN [Litorimonas cladophorae]GGX60857.1 DNA repair protein RecN [Litorimonas cladophorae]
MLSGLSVRNVVLIEQLDLDFTRGLTALTGETGAGKSILLDALGMATGARSDRGLVRAGTDKAQCSASFTLSDTHVAWSILQDQDIEYDVSEDLTLRRTVTADGRSRAFVNDQAVSVKLLSELGRKLLEVHGQHDGRGLLDPTTHIELLDQFGGYTAEVDAVRDAYVTRQETKRELSALMALQAKAGEDREFLEHAIVELDRLDPREGEEDTLAEERRFLQGAEGALSELSAAEDALGEDGAFEARLSTALAGIERLRAKFGDGETPAVRALQSASEALERAMLETQEAREAVAIAAQSFDVEPGRLEETEKRLFSLRAAARKYNVSVADLLSKRQSFATELDAIDSVVLNIEKTRKRAELAKATYDKAAKALTDARMAAAKTLDASVAVELPPLKMERAQFRTDFASAPESAAGVDQVRFLVSTNPGTAIGPLDKIASGGEMARFALAIKVALAGQNNAVMVFDEVDQGVGGAVAAAVGKRLARLADHAQVFTVTHSPQVAACADSQFRIKKLSVGDITTTCVKPILDSEREEEIARMLAGETITQEARAAARQLMAS